MPHDKHCKRCGPLLQSSVVGLPVCLSMCLLVMKVSPAKVAEPIDMPFRGLAWLGPRSHLLDGEWAIMGASPPHLKALSVNAR